MIFAFSLVLFGCNPGVTTTTTTTAATTSSSTEESPVFSVADFYDDMIVYEERIEAIISAKEQEAESSDSQFRKKTQSEDGTETISREEILAAHYNGHLDPVMDSYLQQMSDTRMFVTEIRKLLEVQEGIALNEAFHPDGNSSVTFRFILSEEGYALIDALYGTEHLYLKIGLQDNLLEYQEFHYYFSQESLSPKDDIEMLFNYFKFTENKEAVYLLYSPTQSTLQCTSIENDEEFVISYGTGVLEGSFAGECGYVLNRYDRELNTRSYLQVMDGQIVGETYDVFDEYDQVFRYDDYDHFDGQIRLQVNFVTATGWDYVVASDGSSEQIDALTGVFLANGTKIYDDWFNYCFTPTSGFLGLWIDLDSRYEITDDVFSLNQYGMDLDNPKATVAFLDQVFIEDFSQIQDCFSVEGLDFFTDDLHQELYNFVDEDIRNDLEGNNEEPIETTGNVDEFVQAVGHFEANLAGSPQYTATGTATTELLYGGTVVSRMTSSTRLDFDLEAMFFRDYIHVSGNTTDESFAYFLDGTHGKFVEFEMENGGTKYDILSETATEADFREAYDALWDEWNLSQVYEIRKVSSTKFELNVSPSFLGKNGIDLNLLFEQQGITGLEDQEILVTYEFTSGFDGYTVSYDLTGLSAGAYDVRVTSTLTLTIGPCLILSPMDSEGYLFYLPSSIGQILFTNDSPYSQWILNRGTSYMRLYLEPGEYGIDIIGNWGEPTFTVLDESFHILPYDQRLTATYSGYYYLEIHSSDRMDAFIQIWPNPTPTYYEFDLDSTEGNLEIDLNLDGGTTNYVISVPTFPEDRVLVFDSSLEEILSDEVMIGLLVDRGDDMIYDWFYFDSNQNPGSQYLYLPAGQDLQISLSGYFVGSVKFDYEYLIVPAGAFENRYVWEDLSTSPLLFMTDDSPIARVDFTIEESGQYQLRTTYIDLGYSYQYAVLYRSDGTKITGDWFGTRTLTAGDYYIEYTPGYTSTLLVLVIPSLTRP